MYRTFRLNEKLVRKFTVSINDMLPDYRLSTFAAFGYFQDSVAKFFSDRHAAAYDMLPEGIIWVIPDHTMTVTGEFPLWGDEVTTDVVLSEITPLRLNFDYRLLDRNGQAFAHGSGTWTPVSAETGRPTPIDAVCEINLDPEDGKPATLHKKILFPRAGTMVKEESKLMTFSDMDFNRHVGNRSYINFALQVLPVDLDEDYDVSEISVRFLRQTYIGDTLTARIMVPDAPAGTAPESPETSSAFLVSETNSAGEEVCRLHITVRRRTEPRRDIAKYLVR